MTYIVLVAGKGTRLHPLTLHYPKTLYKLDENTTVLQRMVKKLRDYDNGAEIIVVIGFMAEHVMKELENENVKIIRNPYYAVTNSVASLWFAREYLERDNVTVINGDIVLEDRMFLDFVCKPTDIPYVLVDSTNSDAGDYNVQVKNDKVVVMSKQLTSFYGEYVCLTKLDAISARLLQQTVCDMVNDEMYDQYFENALVQMIFERSFELYYKDCSAYRWTEVDCVDDLLKAREIQNESK